MTDRGSLHIAVLGLRGIPNVQGGIETHCRALYPKLAARGHRVTVFARKGYVPSEAYTFQGVHVVPLWTVRTRSFEAILHSLRGVIYVAIHRRYFDLLHIHGIGPSLVIPIARLIGIPVVMTHHGPDYDRQKWGGLARRMLRFGEAAAARFATEVIAVSKHIRSHLNAKFNREVAYIPNGVDLPEIIPPGEFLGKHRLEPRRYVLAVGRFVPEKGFHDLLTAFRGLDTDWKLAIAGDADHEDEYSRSLRLQASEDPRVVLTGYIRGEELKESYSNAGLFVLPSYHEGLPIVLLEAMSYGLPVIVSDIPANRELAEADETFNAGDVDDLRNKLSARISGIHSPSNGREHLLDEFNWDRISDETQAVYSRAVESDVKGGSFRKRLRRIL